MNNDWVGNSNSVYKTMGASNHCDNEREQNDFYATNPKAIDELLKVTTLSKNLWEPACGLGHLSKRLEELGYTVKSTDLIDRGYGIGNVDFLKCNEIFDGDIITNPPYKYAQQFVEHALKLLKPGHKVFMYLKLSFLEGKSRRKLFDTKQLRAVYVMSSRMECLKNGIGKFGSGAVAYAWFEFEKDYNKDPIIKWIN